MENNDLAVPGSAYKLRSLGAFEYVLITLFVSTWAGLMVSTWEALLYTDHVKIIIITYNKDSNKTN